MEKDYDEFVQRMGSFDMVLGEDQEVQEELKHFGVKGMKWGVRRHQPYQKGDGPKGKFIDAHKKADASKQARRDRTAAKRVSRGKVLDAKFSKFTDAHKKADDTKDARRAKQDSRLKAVKDREKAQGEDASSKVKEVISRQSWNNHAANGVAIVASRMAINAAAVLADNAIQDSSYNTRANREAVMVGLNYVKKLSTAAFAGDSLGQAIVDNQSKTNTKPSNTKPSAPKDPENYDVWKVTGGSKSFAKDAVSKGGYADPDGKVIYTPKKKKSR